MGAYFLKKQARSPILEGFGRNIYALLSFSGQQYFKIDWAIDNNGESIVLDCIDFVKIMTAVNQDAGQMGEISTEVTTVENLHFKN